MKKFDIQRFNKRRIQIGDNLGGKNIYSDFPTGYYNQFSAGTNETTVLIESNGIHIMYENIVNAPNSIEVASDELKWWNNAYRYVDGEEVVSNVTGIDDRDTFNVTAIAENNSSYRHLYIEDIHVRPLLVGDEVTTNTKFYFTIPDDIYTSLSGVTNPITLSGDDGFKINCIGNGSDQTLIRFSNAMGSTEEANIYDMISGTLNTNKSMMQGITTMDSNWVGFVDTVDYSHPLYGMILIDETTLGNYSEPHEIPTDARRIQVGDNLKGKIIYNDFPSYWFNSIDKRIDLSYSNYILLNTDTDDITYIRTEEGKNNENVIYYAEKSSNSNFGNMYYYEKGNPNSLVQNFQLKFLSDKDYLVTRFHKDRPSYKHVYLKDPNIRPVQVGDKLIAGTKIYFNFPDNIYQYVLANINTSKYILNINNDNGSGITVSYGTNFEGNTLLNVGIDLQNNPAPPVDERGVYGCNINFDTLFNSVQNNQSIITLSVDFGEVSEIIYPELAKYISVDVTTLGKEPTTSMGSISYKNGGNWNKLLSLAQEQVPLRGSVVPGPIKWSAVNSIAECTDSKTLYFVFGEEEASPTYETLTAQAKGATYGDSIFGGSGSHTLVVKNSDDEQNEYPYTVSLNGSGFYTDLEFSVVTNKPFQLGITFSYGLDPSMSSNQVSLGATLLDLISYESFSFNTVVTGTEGVGQTYWFPTTNSSGTQLTFDWLKNANLRITSSVSEYGQACLSGDTKIKTLNNDIYISDLELGDKVIDKDNQETEITKIYNHKIDTVYQIHLDNDETIECSYDHKFLVDGGKATTAAQLKENDKLGQYTITSIDIINKELDVYEIKTESNTYTLANGIICECENI